MTTTVTAFSPTVTVGTVLAANAGRVGASIFNGNASANLTVKHGTGATTTLATVRIPPGGLYEMPRYRAQDGSDRVYEGPVTGIWDAATGADAWVTEES